MSELNLDALYKVAADNYYMLNLTERGRDYLRKFYTQRDRSAEVPGIIKFLYSVLRGYPHMRSTKDWEGLVKYYKAKYGKEPEFSYSDVEDALVLNLVNLDTGSATSWEEIDEAIAEDKPTARPSLVPEDVYKSISKKDVKQEVPQEDIVDVDLSPGGSTREYAELTPDIEYRKTPIPSGLTDMAVELFNTPYTELDIPQRKKLQEAYRARRTELESKDIKDTTAPKLDSKQIESMLITQKLPRNQVVLLWNAGKFRDLIRKAYPELAHKLEVVWPQEKAKRDQEGLVQGSYVNLAKLGGDV